MSADLRRRHAEAVKAWDQALARAVRAERHLEEAEDVLDCLVAMQNGPPLETYTEDWTDAMARARKILLRRNSLA